MRAFQASRQQTWEENLTLDTDEADFLPPTASGLATV